MGDSSIKLKTMSLINSGPRSDLLRPINVTLWSSQKRFTSFEMFLSPRSIPINAQRRALSLDSEIADFHLPETIVFPLLYALGAASGGAVEGAGGAGGDATGGDWSAASGGAATSGDGGAACMRNVGGGKVRSERELAVAVAELRNVVCGGVGGVSARRCKQASQMGEDV